MQYDEAGKPSCPIKYDWDDLSCVASMMITRDVAPTLTIHTSICAKIRDEVDGYSASADYWIRCLYEGERGDPEDVKKGFLKSGLLVKVRANLYNRSLGVSVGY